MENPRAMGTLVVVVGKARHLPNKSRFGKQDPFCSVKLGEEKQRTKAIKRGGQHPEWDEELRFTLYEDVEDALSASASTNSLPPVPPKDGSNGILPGTTTAAELAAKSRKKGSGKGNKAMRIACYADDAKEPEIIGECVVDLTDVLKTGEVEEWYVFHNKERYSGEVYLELTFFSNGRPPVRRNVPRPQVQSYAGAGPYSSSSSLSASGSVSGMSLYIPPYVTTAGAGGGGLESLAAEVGSGAGRFGHGGRRESYPPPMHHQSHSLNAFPQPIPSSSQLAPSANPHELDALNRPFSSLSLGQSRPSATPGPASVPSHTPGHNHRHSLTGPPGSEAPWVRYQQAGTPAPIPEYVRPSSTAPAPAPWDQYNAATTVAPPPRPVSQASYLPPSTSYGNHHPIPSSLLPAAPPQVNSAQTYPQDSYQHQSLPSAHLQPQYAHTRPPHPNSAPPAGASLRPASPLPPSASHYQVPLSSFHGVQSQQPPPAPPPERHWSDPYPSHAQDDYSYRNGSVSTVDPGYYATPPPPPPPAPQQGHVPWYQQTNQQQQQLAAPAPPVPHRVSTPLVYPSLYEPSPATQQPPASWQQPPRQPSPAPPVSSYPPQQPPRGHSPAPPANYPPPQPAYAAPASAWDGGYQQRQPSPAPPPVQQPYYPPEPQHAHQPPPQQSYNPQQPLADPNPAWQPQGSSAPTGSKTGKAAWKAYMNSSGGAGGDPPAPPPATNDWYTPPPPLPASIAPPEGWQSTLPQQQQQRQW